MGNGSVIMTDTTFDYTVDVDTRLITLRLFGREPSAHYADKIIELYRAVPDLWRYNRVVDHRKFRGLIVLDDLKRMSEVWNEVNQGHTVQTRVAFLTRSALTQARVNAHSSIFPGQNRRTFTNVAEAMTWVLEPATLT